MWVITENTRAADEPPLDDHREHSLQADFASDFVSFSLRFLRNRILARAFQGATRDAGRGVQKGAPAL